MGLIIAPERFLSLTQFYCLHNSILLKVSHPFIQGLLKEALHLILVFRNPGKKWLFGCATHMNSYTFFVIYYIVQRALAFFEIPQKNWLFGSQHIWIRIHLLLFIFLVQGTFYEIITPHWVSCHPRHSRIPHCR